MFKLRPNTTPTRYNTPRLGPENIRKSTLDFTALFGEIKPDMPYLCRRGQSGPQRAVSAFFPPPLCPKSAIKMALNL